MSMTMNVTSLRSKASEQALRLATDAKDRYRAGSLLLRGSPFAVGWFAGWLTTEFPPQVVTGHAVSRVSPRIGTAWAAQRADRTLTAALEESFGPDFRAEVCHPTCEQSECAPRNGLLHMPG